MSSNRFLLFTVFWVVCLGLLVTEAVLTQDDSYPIGAGDILDIKVFGEPELTRLVEVAEDGTIGFPLLGRIKILGLTVLQVENLVSSSLEKEFLKNPHVSITVQEYHSQKIYVLGAVKQPGYYELTGSTTLLEILSRAGGVLPEGGKTLIVVREDNGTATDFDPEKVDKLNHENTTIIDSYKLLQEGDTSQNIQLKNQDVVYVPKAREVFVLGEVKKPGPITYTENLTLIRAIGQAGGTTELAAQKRVKLVRLENGKKETIKYNLDDLMKEDSQDVRLLPDDVIVVPKRIL